MIGDGCSAFVAEHSFTTQARIQGTWGRRKASTNQQIQRISFFVSLGAGEDTGPLANGQQKLLRASEKNVTGPAWPVTF